MNIEKIALQYQREQDRLLLSLSDSLEGELSLWLTRALLLRWWPHLRQHAALVQSNLNKGNNANPSNSNDSLLLKKVIDQITKTPRYFHHLNENDHFNRKPKFNQNVNFDSIKTTADKGLNHIEETQFVNEALEFPHEMFDQDNTNHVTPLLVTEIQASINPEFSTVIWREKLCINETWFLREYTMTLTPSLLHILVHLLDLALKETNWFSVPDLSKMPLSSTNNPNHAENQSNNNKQNVNNPLNNAVNNPLKDQNNLNPANEKSVETKSKHHPTQAEKLLSPENDSSAFWIHLNSLGNSKYLH